MALNISIPIHGKKVTFWRVENLMINRGTEYAHFDLLGYANADKANDVSNKIGAMHVEVRRDRFHEFFTTKGNQYAQAYKAAVALIPALEKAEKDD